MSIDNPREVPEQWHPHFEKLGIELSYGALERKAEGVGLNTIVRALTGEGKATSKTVSAISVALGITPEKFHELRGAPVATPFTLPSRASQLNQRERDAILGVVHAILAAKEDRHAQPAATTSPSSSSQSGTPSEANEDQEAKPVDLTERRNENRRNKQAAAADVQWPAPDPVALAEGPDGKGEALNTPDQVENLDSSNVEGEDEQWAARKGESKERRRRRLTTAPEDEPQGEAPEGGA